MRSSRPRCRASSSPSSSSRSAGSPAPAAAPRPAATPAPAPAPAPAPCLQHPRERLPASAPRTRQYAPTLEASFKARPAATAKQRRRAAPRRAARTLLPLAIPSPALDWPCACASPRADHRTAHSARTGAKQRRWLTGTPRLCAGVRVQHGAAAPRGAASSAPPAAPAAASGAASTSRPVHLCPCRLSRSLGTTRRQRGRIRGLSRRAS